MINRQPKPQRGTRYVHESAIKRITSVLEIQNQKGFEKYNTYLQTFNNRNVIQDAWEEMADLVNYLEQMSKEYECLLLWLSTLYHNVPEAKLLLENSMTEQELNLIRNGLPEWI